MSLVVKKFGGSSLGSLDKIERVADRLVESHKKGEKAVVVLSAMGGWTNSLEKMAGKIYPDYQGSAYDLLLSSGEQISIALLSLALQKRQIKNQPLLAHQAGIQTNAFFSKAEIKSINTKIFKSLLKQGSLPLVAGFQGITKDNQITTLGRGGSDLTAVALAVALKIPVCEIYTDVLGVFTADPRLYSRAKKIKELAFSEMMEMASLGSKVLQIRSVELANKNNIKIHVLHSHKREQGTWIKKEVNMEGSVVSAIAHDLNIKVIKLSLPASGVDFLSKLFLALGKAGVFVDMISHSLSKGKASLAFSIPKRELSRTLKVLEKFLEKKQISIIDSAVKLSVVGVGMAHHSGVAGRFFSALKPVKTKIYLLTTSEIKISVVIPKKDLKASLAKLHKEFFPSRSGRGGS